MNQDTPIQQWIESESFSQPILSLARARDVPVPEKQREVADETLNWLSTQCEVKKTVELVCQQSLPPSHCAHTWCSNYFYTVQFLAWPWGFQKLYNSEHWFVSLFKEVILLFFPLMLSLSHPLPLSPLSLSLPPCPQSLTLLLIILYCCLATYSIWGVMYCRHSIKNIYIICELCYYYFHLKWKWTIIYVVYIKGKKFRALCHWVL